MTALARRFQFVEESYNGAHRPSVATAWFRVPLDLTHWQGNRTPSRYKADTSTEIALNFVGSPEASSEWADAVVVNNHFDTDGLLSIWVLLDPEEAMARRDLLIAAAEAGDFDEWPALDAGALAGCRHSCPGLRATADDARRIRRSCPSCPS